MNLNAVCEYCGKDFQKKNIHQIGRFCSKLCNRKVLRKNQLAKYKEYLKNETQEQKKECLKNHFEKFVIKNDNCWQWTGCINQGYAKFSHRYKVISAHRASWLIHKGKITKNMFVLHKCDNRSCSNPDHLFLGNQTRISKENIKEIRAILT